MPLCFSVDMSNIGWLINKDGHKEETIHPEDTVLCKYRHTASTPFLNEDDGEIDTVRYIDTEYYNLSKTTYYDPDRDITIRLFIHDDYCPDPVELIKDEYHRAVGWRLKKNT